MEEEDEDEDEEVLSLLLLFLLQQSEHALQARQKRFQRDSLIECCLVVV